MRKLFIIAFALLVANNVMAGPSKDHFASETWAATRIAYNMALFQFDGDTTTTGIEPVICWPFPVEFEVFYRAVQDSVNADVESYPKREQGRLGVTIGWKVWDAIQDNWGC